MTELTGEPRLFEAIKRGLRVQHIGRGGGKRCCQNYLTGIASLAITFYRDSFLRVDADFERIYHGL